MRYQTTTERPTGAFTFARGLSALLGIWLIISPFAWPHTTGQKTNAIICGALAIAFSLASFRDSRARFLNTGLGLWLILSTYVMRAVKIGSSWNELFVGFALVALSLVREGLEEE